ncbi:MAG: hypothetical protein C0483_13200 [Pirellula sp.]|nr:hypothetical protein [Pirellula sp.]
MTTLARRWFVACALSLFATAARAEDFAVENSVFDGKQKLGGSQTIFLEGKVYDFLAESSEAAVFDLAAGRVALCDSSRRVRTELTTQELADFALRLRDRALAGGSEFVKFAAQPTFAQKLEPESNEIVLSSDMLTYRAATVAPKNAEVLRNYQTFIHWQTQLNAIVNPGAPPPQARLMLNDALASRQLLPERITMHRTATMPGLGKTLRAEHAYQWRVSEEQRRRIAELDVLRSDYRLVPIGEYMQAAQVPSGK